TGGTKGAHGQTASPTGSGVLGQSTGAGNGVLGTSSSGIGVLGTGGTHGVKGSGGTNGVYGTTANQPYSGVVGEHTNNGKGVAGYTSGDGYGVWGNVPGVNGVGVFAGNAGGGVALQVSGRTSFSRAGAGTVLNSASKSVTVPGP